MLGKIMVIRKFLVLFCLFFATAAQAEWREARSTHFIVYSEGSEAQLRAFTEKLEKFNFVLRAYHGVREPASPNRLRVFLLPNIDAVGRMAGGAGVAGYYVPDARGLMMVGARGAASSRGIDVDQILLHEYTHHFMYQYFPATYPSWYSEGFAEFWGATRFRDNNVVEVGLQAEGRYRSFVVGRWLPIQRLLTAQSYADVPDIDLLYAQGWLLMRYTFENQERRQQLQQYLNAINAGGTYEEAAQAAFGDLGRFNSELFSYAGRGRLDIARLPFRNLDPGPIEIRTVSAAEDALMEREIRLSQGILQRDIVEFASDTRSIASHFPDNLFALNVLAETEQLAGNSAAAETAVNRALEIDPDNARALMRRAFLRATVLRDANSTDRAAWDDVRETILAANRGEPDNPVILETYYDTYVFQGVLPPEPAQSALYRAMELAPSDRGIRYKLGLDFERRDMIEEAIAVVRPFALTQPHRDDESEAARERRERLEERYRRAGSQRHETLREMLTRLEARLAERTGSRTAATAPTREE